MRSLNCAFVFGLLTPDHELPVQCSVAVTPSPPLVVPPTAQQSDSLAQVTPENEPEVIPPAATIDHANPLAPALGFPPKAPSTIALTTSVATTPAQTSRRTLCMPTCP